MTNCPIDMAQGLAAYHAGSARGYSSMQFTQRLTMMTNEWKTMPYWTDSLIPCSSRDLMQLESCDYDRDKIDLESITMTVDKFQYDEQNQLIVDEQGNPVLVSVEYPVMFVPLPRHYFANSNLLVKYSAGVCGLTNRAGVENEEIYFDLRMYRIRSGSFDPSDLSNLSQAHRSTSAGYIEAGARNKLNLITEGFFNGPTGQQDNNQYILVPSIRGSLGMRVESAFINVELYHEKII